MDHERPENLFHKYGGASTVDDIVHAFYRRVMAERQLEPYFEGVDMERLRSRQTQFMCHLLGGPTGDGEAPSDLRSSHARLGISNAHFATIARLLEASFQDAGFDAADIEQVMTRLRATRPDITGQP